MQVLARVCLPCAHLQFDRNRHSGCAPGPATSSWNNYREMAIHQSIRRIGIKISRLITFTLFMTAVRRPPKPQVLPKVTRGESLSHGKSVHGSHWEAFNRRTKVYRTARHPARCEHLPHLRASAQKNPAKSPQYLPPRVHA